MKFGMCIFVAALLLIGAFCGRAITGELRMHNQSNEVRGANELWEQSIVAKGGREKLHAVRTLVVSSKSEYLEGPKDIRGHHIESFYALPDKLWEWEDYRPGAFGLNISVFDFGRAVAWELSDRWRSAMPIKTKPDPPPNPGSPGYTPNADAKYRSMRGMFLKQQLVYLMETKFLKPSFVRARKTRLHAKNVDVVEGSFDDGRGIQFYLDPKTHLPVTIVFIKKFESGPDYVEVIRLADYVEVSGIQMPSRVSWGSDEDNRTTYQINVSYDPSIFERPPRIDMGPEAWKPLPNH